jgi:hypothetical protein
VSVERATTCAARGCTEPLPPPNRRGGRPYLYCSPSCRPSGAPRSGPLMVEMDHEPRDEVGRPTGRVWLVKIRRGRSEVIVARELGRPTADHLAAQIAEVISPRQWAEGGAMR